MGGAWAKLSHMRARAVMNRAWERLNLQDGA